MPRLDYKTCRHCGRHADEVGALSRHRKCSECAAARLDANNRQISERDGVWYLHQQRRQLMVARKRLLAAEKTAT
jgi:hypothetical protein